MTNTEQVQVNIRISTEARDMLDAIAKANFRRRNTQAEVLIRKAYLAFPERNGLASLQGAESKIR